MHLYYSRRCSVAEHHENKTAELSGFAKTNVKMGEQIVGQGLENGEWTIVGPQGTNVQVVETGTLSFTR